MAAIKIKGISIETIIFDFDGTLAKLNIDFKQMRDAVLKLISSYGIARNYLQTDFVLEMINTVQGNIKSRVLPKKLKYLLIKQSK